MKQTGQNSIAWALEALEDGSINDDDPSDIEADGAAEEEQVDDATVGSDDGEDPEANEQQEKADKNVVVVDTDELTIDKVVEARNDMELEKAREAISSTSQELDVAASDYDEARVAMESFVRIQRGLQLDDGSVSRTLARLQGRYGCTKAYAVESHESAHAVAMEGFKDVMKRVIDYVLKLIRQVYDYVRKAIKSYFHNTQTLREQVQILHEKYAALITAHGKDIESHLTRNGVDTSRYLSDVANARQGLMVDGDFVDSTTIHEYDIRSHKLGSKKASIVDIFEYSAKVVEISGLFTNPMSAKFIQYVYAVANDLEEGTAGVHGGCPLTPAEMLPEGSHLVSTYPGLEHRDDRYIFILDGFLGDVSVAFEVPIDGQDPNRVAEMLNQVGGWRITYHAQSRSQNQSHLPRLNDRALSDGRKGVNILLDRCDDLVNNAKEFDTAAAALEKAITHIRENLVAEDFDAASVDNKFLDEQEVASGLIKASRAWLDNGMTAFQHAGGYGEKIASCWLKYMLQLYKADAELAKYITNQRLANAGK